MYYNPTSSFFSKKTSNKHYIIIKQLEQFIHKYKRTPPSPPSGGISYVVVRPHDVTEFGDIYRLQLVSLDGEVLEDMPLTRLPGSGPVFNGTAFPAPDVPFNIKVDYERLFFCLFLSCTFRVFLFSFMYMWNGLFLLFACMCYFFDWWLMKVILFSRVILSFGC